MAGSESSNRPLLWIGGILVAVGVAALSAYGLFILARDLFSDPETPIVLRLALPAAAVGFIILLAAAVHHRIRQRREEDFSEVDN